MSPEDGLYHDMSGHVDYENLTWCPSLVDGCGLQAPSHRAGYGTGLTGGVAGRWTVLALGRTTPRGEVD